MKRVLAIALLTAVGLALACRDELDPPTTGSIALVIDFSPAVAAATALKADTADGGVRLSVVPGPAFGVAGFTSVTARAEGPTTRSITLALDAGFWVGEITGLQPGSYTVTVEAFIDGELDARGVTSGVEVRAGVAATANVTAPQGGFKPSLGSLPGPSLDTRVPVSFSAVSGATSYRIEWSKNSDFAGARTQAATETSATISASDTGTHNIRVRALLDGTTGTPSNVGQFTILGDQNQTGDDAPGAVTLGFGTAANQTIGSLNIVPASDQDWFAFNGCEDDVAEIRTRAASLTPSSGLNTRLRLFDGAGTGLHAENDDSAGATTDSYIQHTLPASALYAIQVSGVANTTGPYEITITLTAGPLNTGTDCALPQPDTVIIEPASVDFDALGDTVRLSATALDANGDTIQAQTFTWASDDPSVASVDPATGLVTSEANGSAVISATAVAPAAPEGGTDTATTVVEQAADAGPGDDEPAPKGYVGDLGARADLGAQGNAPPNVGSVAVTVQQVPAAILVTPPQDTITFLGGTVQYTAAVEDRLGSVIAGEPVTWSSDNPSVATIDSLGLATAVAVGTVNITATANTVAGSVPLEVLQEPAALPKVGGDNQTGFVDRVLAESLAVRVDDAGGSPIPGVTVTWAITAGGGTLSATSTVTDDNGISRVAWRMGSATGAYAVTATVGPSTATFNAAAVTGVRWLSAVNGSWSDGTKWSTGSPPTSTDPVLIGLDGDYTVTLDIAPTVAFLAVGAPTSGVQTLATSGFNLTVNGSLAVSGGGVLSVSGGSTVAADTMLIGGAGLLGTDGFFDATYISNTSFIDGLAPGVTFDVINEFVNAGEFKVFDNGFMAVSGGAFTNTATGLVAVGVDATLDLTLPTATFDGDLTVDTAGTLNLDGVSATVTSTVTIGINALIDMINTSLTFGSMVNNGAFLLDNSSVTGPITNNGQLGAFLGTNSIDGQITTSVNSGIDVAELGTSLTILSGFTNNGSITLSGTPGGPGVASLSVAGVLVNAPGAAIDLTDIAVDLVADSLDNQGDLYVNNQSCCAEIQGPVFNRGSILVDDGFLAVRGNLTTSGTTTIERTTSTLIVGANTTLSNTGFFEGGGSVDVTRPGASFVNAGGIGVGPSFAPVLAILTVNGDITLTPTSSVDFELGGTSPGVDMDLLVVTGNLAFDGAINALPPAPLTYGDTHQIVRYGSRTGAFTDTTSLDQGPFYLRPEYGASDMTLTWTVPRVVVTPGSATLNQLGATQQLNAEARESDNTPIPGVTFTWASTDSGVAMVDGNGLVTGVGAGQATVIATAPGGTSGTADITVAAPGVASVTVTPDGVVLAVGDPLGFGAEVRDSANNIVSVPVNWTSLNPAAITITGAGVATGQGVGQAVIEAEAGGVRGYATVTLSIGGKAPVTVWAEEASPTSEGLGSIWGLDNSTAFVAGNVGTFLVLTQGSGWVQDNTVPISGGMSDVWGTSGSDILVTGLGGSVAHFDGANWSFLTGAPSTTLHGVWAASPVARWIVGADGTIAFHDGTGWTIQGAGVTTNTLRAVWGTSVTDVVAVGEGGTILHSADGTTWTPQTSPVVSNLVALWGTAPDTYYAVSDAGEVLRYNGTTWMQIGDLGVALHAIWGTEFDNVYVAGETNKIFRYNNATWDTTTVPETHFGLWGAPQSPVFAVGRNGTILRGYPNATVAVSPNTTTLVTTGDTVTLVLDATDAQGNPVPGVTPSWTTLDPGVAVVDASSGLVTAQGPGTASIVGTAPGGAADTATVTVAALFQQVVTGGGHTCGLTSTGAAFCWGLNDRGQLGRTTASFSDSVPGRVVGGHVFKALTAGDLHTCGIDDSDNAWCWGHNSFGSLGNNSTTDSDVPVLVQGGVKWSDLAAGGASVNGIHTCGIDLARTAVYCWGSNSRGQIGPNVTLGQDALVPAPVLSTSGQVLDLSAGGLHTCAVTQAAAASPIAECWGENFNGQLGDGSTTSSSAPVTVTGLSFSRVDAGFAHTCGLEDGTGSAYCWGSNDRGQLGNGNLAVTTDPVPSAVVNVPALVTIASGGRADAIADHSCGTDSSGNTYCWGADTRGQLGNGGANSDTATPTQITSPRLLAVDAGGYHTCGRDGNQKLWCWGGNAWGQIGSNDTADRTTPFLVPDP